MKPTINELLIQDDELTVKRFKNIFKRLNFVKYHLFTNDSKKYNYSELLFDQ